MPSSSVTSLIHGPLSADDEKKPIKVYARVRPFNDEEKERGDNVCVETFDDEKRIKVIDEKHSQETTYHFDGVFSGSDSNEKVFVHTTQHLLTKLLNGINCALLTYGQTGSGKTFTLMADGCITEYAVQELFDKIEADKLHKYKITCSFVQVYLEKVYDLLSHDSKELPVREHPKQGIYVSNLTHHQANSQEEVLALFDKGRQELVTAETKMVRHSSRSHSIFQLSIERRLDVPRSRLVTPVLSTYGNTRSESDVGIMLLEEDMVLRAKMDICDLAGSERLGKTMVEGVHLSEAKHINSSLLELGNVIYALSEGKRRHIPFRNSTLTRLLQECLGSRCQTSFIVCVAPSSGEAYETRCSLNFGTRARTITNKERMCLNVEQCNLKSGKHMNAFLMRLKSNLATSLKSVEFVRKPVAKGVSRQLDFDYKLLAKKLTKRVELLELELQSARPIRDFISSSINGLNIATETQTDGENTIEKTNSTVPTIIIKCAEHALDIYGMLELLTENNENLHQHSSNYDTLRSTSAMALFTMAISSIAKTQKALISGKEKSCSEVYSYDTLIEESLQKMAKIKSEILHIKRADKNDLFIESAYMISEICTDIENVLEKVVAEIENTEYKPDKESSLYKKVSNALQIISLKCSDKDKIAMLIHNFLNILQIFQITRILLESSRWHSSFPNSTHKKSFIASSFIEQEIWDPDNTFSLSSNEDAYFSDFSSMADSARFERIKVNQMKKEKEFLEKQSQEKCVLSPLSRSHSVKTKKEMWSTQCVEIFTDCESNNEMLHDRPDEFVENNLLPTRLIRRRSKISSFDYPLTLTKRYTAPRNDNVQSSCSDVTELDNYFSKSEFGELEKRYTSLANKFENLTNENMCLNDKLTKVQNDKMTLMSERDYARRQINTFLHNESETRTINNAKNNYSEEVTQINWYQKELEYYKAKFSEQEDLIKKLDKDIKELTFENDALKEKESSNAQLLQKYIEAKQMEDKNIEVESKMQAFATDILSICNWLCLICDHKLHKRPPGSAEDISSLEQELFKITENLVKHEAAIKEIRIRSNKVAHNDDGEKKPEESIEESIKIFQKNTTSNKVIAQNIPAYITKKINTLKKEQKKLVNNVRSSYIDQPISSVKEIKLCRASRVKELIQEKIKMAETISSLEIQVSQKETQIREQRKQIELLIQELAKLDSEESKKISNEIKPDASYKQIHVLQQKNKKTFEITIAVDEEEDLEIINIPEIKYTDLMKLASMINNKELSIANVCNTNTNGCSSTVEMVPIQIVEQIKEELETIKKEKTNIVEKYESGHLFQENNSLHWKIQCLTESNNALIDENKILKATCQKCKVQLKELREKSNFITTEFEKAKRNNLTTQAKSESNRQKLDHKLLKMKGKILRLEKYSKNLEDNLKLLKKEASINQTFNDSGLVQDDCHYIYSS
ncbi:kinesin-related protein 5 isoform X2 [Hydra vulgaris]|uniref:kinesin-related protein 5 isoform X2 n=1 Tax=Hydra vulgaris TaxID=6087 RepID=UPI001F5E4456|nr:kinesin-related protein 5 isoform X2 [Hydra vulgaris]